MGKWTEMLRYLDYLKETFGYRITIKDFMGFISKDPDTFEALSRFYLHPLPICAQIKNTGALFDTCQTNTRQLERRCREQREPFIGSCYCGIYELILPVFFENTLLAAICVAGFDCDRAHSFEKMERVVGSGSHFEKLKEAFVQSTCLFDYATTDWETVKVQLGVLSEYIRLNYILMVQQGLVTPHKQYSNCAVRLWALSYIIEYIHAHYTEPITIAQVCEHFQYSSSYVSHTFNRFMGMNFNCYINKLRIQKAQDMMMHESLSVTDLALKCGFSDPNYFSYVFKKTTGMTPSAYKRSLAEPLGPYKT